MPEVDTTAVTIEAANATIVEAVRSAGHSTAWLRPVGGGDRRTVLRRITIRTARLILQPIRRSHAERLLQATSDSRTELLPWMPWAKDPTLSATLAAVRSSEQRWRDGDAFHFAVTDPHSGLVLGVVGLDRCAAGDLELHYWIHTGFAGRGLATEAAQAAMEWAERLRLASRFTLWAGRDNAASRRVAIKLGFVHAGPLDWQPAGGSGHFPAERYERPAAPQPVAAFAGTDGFNPAATPRR